MGFDSSVLAKMSNPHLTTMDPNNDLQADMIIKLILSRIDGDNSP